MYMMCLQHGHNSMIAMVTKDTTSSRKNNFDSVTQGGVTGLQVT